MNCLCGSDLEYAKCCALLHQKTIIAKTAEALMRSRFTAYVNKNSNYLLDTWDKTTRPKGIDFTGDNSQWLSLEIIKTKKGKANDKKGVVEFKAYFIQEGKTHILSEVSRFIKKQGQWFYVDGKVKIILFDETKV